MGRSEGYVISREGLEKMNELGITGRIEEIKKRGNLEGMSGFISESDVASASKRLVSGKFFDYLPKEGRELFFQSMNQVFKDTKTASWKINNRGKEVREQVVTEDFILLIGDSASQVLEPREFGDYLSNGFGSLGSWIGCVGALVEKIAENKLRERSYSWESNLSDGRKLTTSIGGSMHGDLRVKQVDFAFYETVDPLGNPVQYRPIGGSDVSYISAFHSTEPNLLVATLNFIDQRRIDSEIMKDKARGLIEEIRGGSSPGGNWAEAHEGPKEEVSICFVGYNLPMPRILDDGTVTLGNKYGLTMECGRSCYVPCITREGNLGFYIGGEKIVEKPELVFEFRASEVDHVIKGLFHQASNGLGRTNPGTLANILEYRFSEEFVKSAGN